MQPSFGPFEFTATPNESGQRLDALVTARLAGPSRSFVAALVKSGEITVGGAVKKPGYKVRAGDRVSGSIPKPAPCRFSPEPMALPVVHEDGHIIVINKPAGLVVHPAPGHFSGTLVNGLLHLCPDLTGVGSEIRPGIVHRLDKDTSGIMVVAKNDKALAELSRQFARRAVQKTYLAVARGRIASDSGVITHPVGRHRTLRKKMSIHSPRGKPAQTFWRVVLRLKGAALVQAAPKTGRTHQIRVHLASMGHPVAGDPVYGTGRGDIKTNIPRLMLHAWRLVFTHPASGRVMAFHAPLPADMRRVIQKLRTQKTAGSSG